MTASMLNTISHLKDHYQNEGVVILGVFGSYARGDATESSDVDVLYELSDGFRQVYRGFKAFHRLNTIRKEMEMQLDKSVDLVDKSALGAIGKKYILNEVVYV